MCPYGPTPKDYPMTKQTVEPFVVRHYAGDERPTIKGNGFDGLEVGETREDAQEFVDWLNARLADEPKAELHCDLENGPMCSKYPRCACGPQLVRTDEPRALPPLAVGGHTDTHAPSQRIIVCPHCCGQVDVTDREPKTDCPHQQRNTWRDNHGDFYEECLNCGEKL